MSALHDPTEWVSGPSQLWMPQPYNVKEHSSSVVGTPILGQMKGRHLT